MLSAASAGCLVWLDTLRPAFATTAAGAMAYQIWLVTRRPSARRTRTVWLIVSASIVANLGVLIVWAVFWLRYQ